MMLNFRKKNVNYCADLSNPLDISIPLTESKKNVSAWYVDSPLMKPVKGDGFIGSVALGGSVNFRTITFNPHGHGTHTESVGHIDKTIHSINKVLTHYHFYAYVLSVKPTDWQIDIGTRKKGDLIIELDAIKSIVDEFNPEALIIRTFPNSSLKQFAQYSNTNPAYLCDNAAKYMTENGVNHLLIDLPSVDKEYDKGELLSHKAFWKYPNDIQFHKTITELIYVPNEIKDGEYLLNLQIAPFENDATPSKPVLYKLEHEH